MTDQELINFTCPFLQGQVKKKWSHIGEEILQIRFVELLKYLYLVSKYVELKGSFIPVTQDIDNLWHEMILQTKQYQDFCKRLPGGHMVHHQSADLIDYKANFTKEQFLQEVLLWVPLYAKNFGPWEEKRIKYWFFIDKVVKTLKLSITDLNQMALKGMEKNCSLQL